MVSAESWGGGSRQIWTMSIDIQLTCMVASLRDAAQKKWTNFGTFLRGGGHGSIQSKRRGGGLGSFGKVPKLIRFFLQHPLA